MSERSTENKYLQWRVQDGLNKAYYRQNVMVPFTCEGWYHIHQYFISSIISPHEKGNSLTINVTSLQDEIIAAGGFPCSSTLSSTYSDANFNSLFPVIFFFFFCRVYLLRVCYWASLCRVSHGVSRDVLVDSSLYIP